MLLALNSIYLKYLSTVLNVKHNLNFYWIWSVVWGDSLNHSLHHWCFLSNYTFFHRNRNQEDSVKVIPLKGRSNEKGIKIYHPAISLNTTETSVLGHSPDIPSPVFKNSILNRDENKYIQNSTIIFKKQHN